jgi:hypothetical protein
MENKKSNLYISLLVMFVIVMFIFLFLYYMEGYVTPDPVGDCKRECDLVNGTFVKYTPSGYAPSECWCRIDGIPERIG